MFSFEHLKTQIGETVTIEGFVHTTRIQSKMAFIVLESGPSRLQIVCSSGLKEEAKALSFQSYARLSGLLIASTQAPGGMEMQAEAITLISKAEQWPIAASSEIGLKLEHPMARFRERTEALILQTQSELEYGMIHFLRSKGFIGIHSPKLIAYPSESGAEVFEVKYFGEKAYLAQSPQMVKQLAAMSLGKIYEVGPVFRAEPSSSSRHATEFVSFDVEWQGVYSETELIELECEMIRFGMTQTLETMGAELLSAYPQATLPGPVKIMPFKEAQTRLGLTGYEALSAEEERRLGALMLLEGHELVALTQVPWAQRPFYHMQKEGEPQAASSSGATEPTAAESQASLSQMPLTKSFELIYRGVEITTGAIREHRHAVLMKQLAEKGLTGAGMEFYFESFKLGAPPHGGFGLGLSRLVMLFLGLPGIKEATFIHRGPGRLTP